MAAALRTAFRLSFLSLALLWLQRCGAGPVPAPLPPPQVIYLPTSTPPALLTPLPASPSPNPAPTPTEAYPADYLDLYQLARQIYGEDRLIRWISIPALNVESLVVPVGWHVQKSKSGREQVEWDSPGPFVGWAIQSALPGEQKTILLYGHNNLYGSVFRNLYRLKRGDSVILHTSKRLWEYTVEQVKLVAVDEQPAPLSLSKGDLVIISCYPPTGNDWRVLVFASLQMP
jgi:LPXTG-site transpeptidase (sortase) family protein